MHRFWLASLLFWLLAWPGAYAAAADQGSKVAAPGVAIPAPALPERIIAEARRILADAKTSEYSHKTKVDEETGSYAFDCSGLALLILKQVAPEQLALVRAQGRNRPRAVEFHQAFTAASPDEKQAKGWQRIDKLLEARPGDIIAWRKEEIIPGDSTGHVMLIDQPPVEEKNGRIRVVVIDSTSSLHADDSRGKGESGIGRGTMWFSVDATGKPTGYRWRARNGALHEAPIAIGRAVPGK